MRVLVTGSEGYMGTILVPYLLTRGYDVVGLDTGFHRIGRLYDDSDRAPACIRQDTRRIMPDDLRGFDAVVHLAELSNDPVGELDPAVTLDINYRGSLHLATLAKRAGVRHFIYMSSCSVYGAAGDTFSTEDSELRPLSTYARCKVLVEQALRSLADDAFSPTILRSATAYGASPRQRFDIVVNHLVGRAWTERVIRLASDGRSWRPFVHVLDISAAIECVLRAPREIIHGDTFNVGDNDQNYQITTIAEMIADSFANCTIEAGAIHDNRDYRVDFTRIHTRLPGFVCRYDVPRGVGQLLDIFRRIGLDADAFAFRGYTRIKQIEYLLATRQVDDRLFWLVPPDLRG